MRTDARLDVAVAAANDFLAGCLTPLQTAVTMTRIGLVELPGWEALQGANGPLPAFYAAEDEADRLHFLGTDVERWHPDVREMKRAELAAAEAHWRAPVENACRALISYATSMRDSS